MHSCLYGIICTRSTRLGQKEKEGKEARKRRSSQGEPALEKGEEQLKSAKTEIRVERRNRGFEREESWR